VGIDFGLKTFLALSDENQIESPLCHLKNLKEQKMLAKKLSSKVKGSRNRKKAKSKLAKLHIKTANQRKDYFHKLTNKLAWDYDVVYIEDLNLKAMQKLWGRKISDLAYAEFINLLEYKTKVVKIDRFFPSSKTCSFCGNVKEKLDLSERTYHCSLCKENIDRDLNASINILRVGTSTLAGETVRAIS